MSSTRRSRPLAGTAAAVIGAAVLTAFAALVPAAGRKLGLFAVLYGICVGGIVLWAAREFVLNRSWAAGLTAPLVIAGLTAIAVQGHRQLHAELAEAAKDDPQRKFARRILQAAAEADPEVSSELARQDRSVRPTFADYLALRVKPLGEWNQPWPGVFWAFEAALAAAAGAILVSRRLRGPERPVEEKA